MATKTFEELKQLAIQIRDEKTNKQNTATRIGTQMLEHLNKLEQDYYDKTATDEELKQRDEKLTELSSLYLLSGYSSQESTAVKNFQYFRVLIDIDITNLRIATIYNDSSIQKRIIIKTNDNADWKLINMTSNYYADSEIELYYDWEKHSNNVNNSGSSSCIAILESSKINKVIKENSKNIKNLYLISKNATFNVYSENNTENELKILSCFKQIRILGEYKDLCINTIYNSESIPKRIIIRTFDNSIQQTINFIENHYEGNTQLGYIIIDFDWDYFITNCININDIGNKYIIIKSDAFIDKLYENINDVEDIKGNIIIPETEEIQYDEIIQAYPNYVTGTFVVGTQVYAKTAVFAIQKNVEYVISGNTVGPTDSSYCSIMFTTDKDGMSGESLLNTNPNNIGEEIQITYTPTSDGYLFIWLYKSMNVPYVVGKKIGNLYLPKENEKKIELLENSISTEIQDKNLVVLGDSIMMLMRTNSVPSNTITYQDDEGKTYDYSLLTNKNGHLYVTSTLQDGNVIETSKMVDIVNSSQDAFDSQNWEALKQKLRVKNLYNFGLGGAMFAERQIITSYPYPDGNGYTTDLPNEVRWLIRRYTEGNVEYPDCIVIWLGTNGAGEPSSDNYSEIMTLTYDELNSDEHYTDRKTLYGGLRWSLETLYRTFQYTTIILVTPVQTNPENYRTYDKLTTTANAIKKMAGRYSCMVFDALNEIGVVDFFEKSDGSGYFLSDGLHPKSAGKVLWKNYLSQKLISFYYSKR
ncbi:hypothetical protein [Phocaeicola barnesiae]|uniref:hypothetical protein n=1 Tax=Phocaeicola barnesiae TaxID=376804 RepID=UPI0025A3EC71|nr:hypothetical protein [Phocaeicola barnesiae]MDM8309707.1 hypothetical protein [Phocaeicola barnesiae]